MLVLGEKICNLTKLYEKMETTIIRSLELNFCIHMDSQSPTMTSMHIEKLADEFDSKTAQEVLKWALDTFGTKIALASSFGA